MGNEARAMRWKKIATWSLVALAVGGVMSTLASVGKWNGWVALPFNLAMVAGLVMTYVSAPKVIGALRAGVISLVSGAVMWVAGMIMKGIPEPSMVLGVEFPPLGDPLYVIGWDLVNYGAVLFIVGVIMAGVSYLRRVLNAVEGKSSTTT